MPKPKDDKYAKKTASVRLPRNVGGQNKGSVGNKGASK